MSSITLAGLVLSVLFMLSPSVYATSVDLFQDTIGNPLVSSTVVNVHGSPKSGATPALANYASAIEAPGVRFASLLVDDGAARAPLPSIRNAGESLGFATVSRMGSLQVSPRCFVPASDPSPSVAPESSTALLFGLGLAALSCVGLRRRRVRTSRQI